MILFLVLRSFPPLNFYCAGGSHVVMWWGFATACSSHVQVKVLNNSCSWSLLLSLIWVSEFYHTDNSASCWWSQSVSCFCWGRQFVLHDFFLISTALPVWNHFQFTCFWVLVLCCALICSFFVFVCAFDLRKSIFLQSHMQDWPYGHPHSPLHQPRVSRYSTTE